MLVDILLPKYYNTYSIKLAQLWGLECSVYFSTILSMIENNFLFTADEINRNIIKDKTTLSIEQQIEYDKQLIDINILEKIDDITLKVNVDNYTALFSSSDGEVIKEVSSVVKKRKTKADFAKDNLKTFITTTDPKLRDSYSAWIESVFAKQGWMSRKSVEVGQSLLNSYTNNNPALISAILDIASINGYRDIQWAINKYEETKPSINNFGQVNKSYTPVKLAKDIF